VKLDSLGEREAALRRFIDESVAELQPLQREHNEAMWLANVTGDPAHAEKSAALDARIRTLFSRREPYAFLIGLEEAGGVGDAALARQLRLLVDAYRGNQIPPESIERMVRIEKSLESRFNNFRAELNGRRVGDNEIRQLLQTSSDDNYYTMMLTLDELDERELFVLLEDLDAGTRPRFERYKADLDQRLARRFGIPVSELRPWHLSDPFFQEAPAADVQLDPYFANQSLEQLTAEFFAGIGLDIADLLSRADLYEKPGKSQHAFCLDVDRGRDIRVLCNLRPNEQWMGTMLHEFGHAAYDKFIDPGLPYLLRGPAHTLSTEASAMLFGRLSKNAAWLERYAGVASDEARSVAEACARGIRDQLLVQTRWCLVMCHMERALYRDPDQDLNTLWWDLVERFQLVARPVGRRAPDWASKIHFSVAPVYYHNYMLGEIMASQLQHHILTEVTGGPDAGMKFVSSPEVGAYLIQKLYRLGKSVDWRGAIQSATGAALNASAFVAELNGAAS